MDFPRALVIFLVILLFYLASQVYLFLRVRNYLRRRVSSRGRQRLLLSFVGSIFLLALFPIVWRFVAGWQSHPPLPGLFRSLSSFCAVWGFGSIGAVLILLSYELSSFFLRLFRKPAAPPDLQRREFLKRGVGIAAAAPFLVSGYGVVLGRHRFQVEDFDLPVSDLSSDLSQFSIVQLTDIHLGPFMPAEELARYVEAINRLQPDLIALTGDFISTTADEVAPCVDTLAGLKARYGVFACMGNHDVYARADGALTRDFTEKGIRVLRNDAVSLPVKQTKLNILGIDDLRWGRPDLPRALKAAARDPGEVKLLLFQIPRRHNGPEADQRDAVLFVGRGVGITGLPIRINCPPQIAHLTLRKA